MVLGRGAVLNRNEADSNPGGQFIRWHLHNTDGPCPIRLDGCLDLCRRWLWPPLACNFDVNSHPVVGWVSDTPHPPFKDVGNYRDLNCGA